MMIAVPMTTEEKAAAFDLLVSALVNKWHDGRFSANCTSLVNAPNRATPEECVPDILDWAAEWSVVRAKRRAAM